jgi:TonB family protein
MREIHSSGAELPDDLRALDEELSALRYEERPSFHPELRAELARVWAEQEQHRPSPVRRYLAAAVVAAILVGGAAVPSARASLVRFLGGTVEASDQAPATTLTPALAEASEIRDEGEPVEVAPLAVEAVSVEDVLTGAPPTIVGEPVIIAPEMLDRVQTEDVLQAAYPMYLQRRGVGGTVWLQLWVDETGVPGAVEVSRSSGVSELDGVAVRTSPRFRFAPALQDGRPTGTWIEFPVLFEPDPDRVERILKPVVDPLSLPRVDRDEWWQLQDPLDLESLPARGEIGVADARSRAEASEGLAEALSQPELVDEYGPAESILSGAVPGGVPPTEWRAAVGAAFGEAIEQGAQNPAAMLALGRIRISQGLRAEARALFEEGLRIAIRDREQVGGWVVAELHYERGSLVRDLWLGSHGVGRVQSQAFTAGSCTSARSSGHADYGFASVDRLIAWNYLCPGEMKGVFDRGFEEENGGGAADLTLMMASFRAAVEAYPGHVEANTDLLVTLAQEERWEDLLAGARRFTRASDGHPNGLLLAAIALHRLDRSAEAAEHFHVALERMAEPDADRLSAVGVLLDGAEAAEYARLSPAERRTWETSYWAVRDRAPSTVVNERWVEHLARTSYARLRFGSVFGDAAEVWVRFGRPNHVNVVDDGTGRLTEFWDYGSGPDITFVRWVSAKRTDLTPEGRAYVDDLGKIFPPQ